MDGIDDPTSGLYSLKNFVIESMAIERVNDPTTLLSDIKAHAQLLAYPSLNAEAVAGFARAIDKNADYMKSPEHAETLDDILQKASVARAAMGKEDELNGVLKAPMLAGMVMPTKAQRKASRDWLAYLTHRALRELDPFAKAPMNGVVSRAIWLWTMEGDLTQSFLSSWYNQSLRFGGVAQVEKVT